MDEHLKRSEYLHPLRILLEDGSASTAYDAISTVRSVHQGAILREF